ncbi:MAG: UvrD-helicase domain-containing protein [Acidobacteriaceae bacterium]
MPEDFDAPLFAAQTPQPQPSQSSTNTPIDQPQRDRAIQVNGSFIVQAPAGSGKTDLLTRRFLALLAEAPIDSPDQILAITFTRAATAEMRNRILSDLRRAAATPPSTSDDERIQFARRALARSQQAGWHILEQPNLLQIETIDSLCMRIAQGQPLTARLGGRLEPVEDANALYQEAARRTIRNLGGDNSELNDAIEHLLALRDNNLADCETLIANMLARRDQWEADFPMQGKVDWNHLRSILEKPLREEVSRTLTRARTLLLHHAAVAEELLLVAHQASRNREDGALALLAHATELPPPTSPEHWQAISTFLLKKNGDWYTKFNARNGLPAGKAGSDEKEWNQRGNSLLDRLRNIPGLHESLRAIRTLPAQRYTDDQWTTLRHLFTTLYYSLAELRVLFAQRNQIDFLYSSSAALDVLRHNIAGFSWADNIHHLLVDEFQDTSRRQHDLIATLVAHWSGDPSRTVFAVGDPMQSIYLFRQAEVELFEAVRRNGIRNDNGFVFPLEALTLSVNFRSHDLLTTPLNQAFEPVFAANTNPQASPVTFTPSTAHTAAVETIHTPAFQIHTQLLDAADKQKKPQRKLDLQHREANLIADIIQAHLPRIEQARHERAEYRVAVIVRNRSHLAAIAPTLRRLGIPYRAVEIEPLAERQELLDLNSLIRALLHPMDRIAWLAVLRAPWCGLTLADLHILTGSDHPSARATPMLDLIEHNQQQLNPGARQRLQRTVSILRRALDARPRQSQIGSFAEWIERTWRALGGHLCLNATALENSQVFFALLDSVAPDAAQILSGEFQRQLEKLYAQPDPSVSETCGVQLMTIHKAKGLGFDVVIVPALERGTRREDPPLIASLQRSNPQTGQPEYLIAPIGEKGAQQHRIYDWIQSQIKHRNAEETKRLFYVACTRARQELHLIGTASFSDKGLATPRPGSLLHTAWPALAAFFEAAYNQQQPEPAPQPYGAEIIAFPTPSQPGELAQVAAQTEAQPEPTFHRLRLDANLAPASANVAIAAAAPASTQDREFHRPEGSRLARVIGSTLHLLLQRLGPQIAAQSIQPVHLESQITALLRASALDARQSQTALRELLQMIAACQADPIARWLLAEHPGAQSEASWTGWLNGTLRTLRADRIFHAGPEPLTSAGPQCLWIIDYKTSHNAAENLDEFFASQRLAYSPQLAAYARVARAASSAIADMPVRLGLYYPGLTGTKRFDWWEG